MATFQKAVEWMKEGKTVHRRDWGEMHVFLDKSKGPGNFEFKGHLHGDEFMLKYYSIEATDWEIYEEEPKSLGDEIMVLEQINCCDVCDVASIKRAVKRLKKDLSLSYTNVLKINEIFGSKLTD